MTEARRDDRTSVFCGGGSVSDAAIIVPVDERCLSSSSLPHSAWKLTVRQRRPNRSFEPVLFSESVEPVLRLVRPKEHAHSSGQVWVFGQGMKIPKRKSLL